MLGTVIYALIDIAFNLLLWTIMKTSMGISMLYYYYTNDGNVLVEIPESELEIIKEQIKLQTKLIEELKNNGVIDDKTK